MDKLLVISSAPLIYKKNKYFAYTPYEREMQIWAKNSKNISFCCPVWYSDKKLLNSEIYFEIKTIYKLKEFNIQSLTNIFKAIYCSIYNSFILFKAIYEADHIHLRCPGNMGLLGCFIQILFPKKKKTAKYAGNWDPKSKQPLSYRLQKWILNNTFLTRNMSVLVYGDWENSSKNIKPFFTASYFDKDKINVQPKQLDKKINFMFVGALTRGKQPLYAIQLIEQVYKKGFEVQLLIFGEGEERDSIEKYISKNHLEEVVYLRGNKQQEFIKEEYIKNHFVVLPSLSEGWPKVVAEGMFWRCLPIASRVSCVPEMLDNGNRGVLLELQLDEDVDRIVTILTESLLYQEKVKNAINWSRLFTLDVFEEKIRELLVS